MTTLLVLAGGFGSRLKPVVSDVPKALAPIGSNPFLHYQIQNWKSQGVKSFVFLLYFQADLIKKYLAENAADLLQGCDVRIVVEPEPMDTGGAIAYALEELGDVDDFVVVNADTWLGTGVDLMIESSSPSIATIHVENVSRYGEVTFDVNMKVSAFMEKGFVAAPGWINAGVSRLSSELFEQWDGKPCSLERSIFPQLIQEGKLEVVCLNTDFIDIGIPEDYFRLCQWIQSGHKGKL